MAVARSTGAAVNDIAIIAAVKNNSNFFISI